MTWWYIIRSFFCCRFLLVFMLVSQQWNAKRERMWRKARENRRTRDRDDGCACYNVASASDLTPSHSHFECIAHFEMAFTRRLLSMAIIHQSPDEIDSSLTGKWPKFQNAFFKICIASYFCIWEMIFFAFRLAIKRIFPTISEIKQPFGSLFWPVA